MAPDNREQPDIDTGDTALALRAGEGEEAAFECLVKRYQRFVYRSAFFVTGKNEDAEDLTQEIFLKLWRGLPRFRGESRFFTYLSRVIHNACADYIRRKKQKPEMLSFFPQEEDEDASPNEPTAPPCDSDPAEILSQRERAALVRKAIGQLSPAHQMILALRDTEGMQYEDIAALLGIDVGTVKSRLFRARKNVREYLRNNGFDT